jgi:hypothetical protein
VLEQNISIHGQGEREREREEKGGGGGPVNPFEGVPSMTLSFTGPHVLKVPLPLYSTKARDQIFNTWAFGEHYRSKLQ